MQMPGQHIPWPNVGSKFVSLLILLRSGFSGRFFIRVPTMDLLAMIAAGISPPPNRRGMPMDLAISPALTSAAMLVVLDEVEEERAGAETCAEGGAKADAEDTSRAVARTDAGDLMASDYGTTQVLLSGVSSTHEMCSFARHRADGFRV